MSYDTCCVCFEGKLVRKKCDVCNYWLCIDCTFKISKIKLNKCMHEKCLDEWHDPKRLRICRKMDPQLEYRCPTCVNIAIIDLSVFDDMIKERVSKRGYLELVHKTSFHSFLGVLFYSVLNLDDGTISLKKVYRNDMC